MQDLFDNSPEKLKFQSFPTCHRAGRLRITGVYALERQSVQWLSCVQYFVTPWTAARQASQSITISQSLLKLMSIELVMPSNNLMVYDHITVSWCGLNCPPKGISSVQFSRSVMSDSATPWTAAYQASLAITISGSLLKLMSIELVMPSNHLVLCRPLLLLPSTFPSIKVFSNELALCIRWPKYWSFSFSISPSNEYSGLIGSCY